MQKLQAIATWNPEHDLWETNQEDIFGHSDVYSETLPKSGMTRNGQLYELPTLVPRTTEPGYSSPRLLPTPRTTDSHGPGRHGTGGQDLRTVVAETLTGAPTPKPSNDGND